MSFPNGLSIMLFPYVHVLPGTKSVPKFHTSVQYIINVHGFQMSSIFSTQTWGQLRTMVVLCILLLSLSVSFITVDQYDRDPIEMHRHRRLQIRPTKGPTPTLLPLHAVELIGFMSAAIGLVFAAGGGIGGGGIIIPIYILIIGLPPKYAIPLANVTVLGGSIANTWINSTKKHPSVDRPLIDWDLVLIMQPLNVAGALLGALLNHVLSDQWIAILLVLVLTFTAYTTLQKAFQMHKKESDKLIRIQMEQQSLLPDKRIGTVPYNTMGPSNHAPPPEEQSMVGLQQTQGPVKNLKLLLLLSVVVIALNILKGGDTSSFPSPLGIQYGSSNFWLANATMILWTILITHLARSYIFTKQEIMHVEGDINWDRHSTLYYPIISSIAGVFSGLFGIGGGIILGPLFLAAGVLPEVSAASTACMIFFTSLTASTSFMVFGLLLVDYGIVCFLLGFFSAWIGQSVMSILMKNSQRKSYIAFLIGGVVLLSAVLMTVQAIVQTFH